MFMDMAFPTPEQLTDTLNPLLTQFGVIVENIKVTKAGAKSAVRIAVDAEDPTTDSPDLDAIEEISKEISRVFDEAEEAEQLNFGSGYTLEVSTPGLEFPLTLPRHWKKNEGRIVTLPQAGSARVLLADEGGVVLLKKNKKKTTVITREFGDVEGAVVEVEFNKVPEGEAKLIGLDRHAYEPLLLAADEENK